MKLGQFGMDTFSAPFMKTSFRDRALVVDLQHAIFIKTLLNHATKLPDVNELFHIIHVHPSRLAGVHPSRLYIYFNALVSPRKLLSTSSLQNP